MTTLALTPALLVPQALAQPKPDAGPDAVRDVTPAAGSADVPGIAEARAAFQEGVALAKEERWALALEALERSRALHPHAVTTYNIGYCERQMGHWIRARKILASALAEDRVRGEVELPTELVSAAQMYLRDADRQIARMIVTVPPGAVAVDGRPLERVDSDGTRPMLLAGTRNVGPPEAAPSAPFEVLADPGTHVFVLSVKDRPDVIATRTLAPGSEIVLQLRVPDAVEGVEAFVRPSESRAVGEEIPSRVPALVAFGVGAVGVAAGTVSGLVAFGKRSEVKQACSAPDPSRCSTERESGNRLADISTGSFIGAGVAVVVGAVLVLVAAKRTTRGTRGAPKTRSDVWPTARGLEGRF